MISSDDFPIFVEEVFGYRPFPWQERLVRQVIESGAWPDSISIPTGAGKTSVVEIGVFALAMNTQLPRRMAFVVDRRVVVDAAFRRAQQLQHALVHATEESVVGQLAALLLTRGGSQPLAVAELRGGIPQERLWAEDPLQPLVVCSTVDQVGSRILFQGYGVSDSMKPVHAALLGNDAVVILDEAHVSEPFRQTMRGVQLLRTASPEPVALPFSFVTMTATPSEDASTVFTLNNDDRSHPILKNRMAAQKHGVMIAVPSGNLSVRIAQEAILLSAPGATILVVVNRVATARSVADDLKGRLAKKKQEGEIIVLTGRSRPVDREQLIAAYASRLFSGRSREAVGDPSPLFVVATQTIEVGADIDADALVTEACPLDSLLQRAGRIDRLGERGTSKVSIVGSTRLDTHDPEKNWEPVYGTRTALTWNWLRTLPGPIDLGIKGWSDIADDLPEVERAAMISESPDAPALFPAYLDLWSQTRPAPPLVPDPAVFLHGPETIRPDVHIVWRADLAEPDEIRPDSADAWIDTISAFPPTLPEAIPVPFHVAVQWLSAQTVEDTSDTEGNSTSDSRAKRRDAQQVVFPFIVWRGNRGSFLTSNTDELRPGDVIVVPSSRGGADQWGWNGAVDQAGDIEPVPDRAEAAAELYRRKGSFRLHPSVIPYGILAGSLPSHSSVETIDPPALNQSLRDIAQRVAESSLVEDAIRRHAASALRSTTRFVPHPSGVGWLVPTKMERGSSTESELGSAGVAVELDAHLSDVQGLARRFADGSGLADNQINDIDYAAHAHDIGKADPRFQTLLHGGNVMKALRGPLLAKSNRTPTMSHAQISLRSQSGYPAGARHEVLSWRLIQNDKMTQRSVSDWDLVQYLVLSHHGWGRPMVPPFDDPLPRNVVVSWRGRTLEATSDASLAGVFASDIDSGVTDLFWRLTRRFGWWGLAYLETMVRLADHQASASEARSSGIEGAQDG